MSFDSEPAECLSKEELDEFKSDYMKHGKFNLEVQIPHLTKLAERYFARYKNNHCWTDALKAFSLYNSLRYRQPTSLKWKQKLFEVQQECWGRNVASDINDIENITLSLLTKLRDVRRQIGRKLELVENMVRKCNMSEETEADQFITKFCDEMEKISKFTSEQVIEVFGEVFQQSINLLKPQPPCSFEVIAIGSLARGEATPYSDLEYIFLVEQKDDTIEKYFEQLAMTSYFIIGNFGETKLNTMEIDELTGWFDDKQRNGLRIDGLSTQAGNIPTGNGKQTKNRFIVTPDQLWSQYTYVLANPVTSEAMRGDLTALLQYTQSIFQFGVEELQLLQQFTSRKRKVATDLCEDRAIANVEMFQSDAKKYNFKPETHVIKNAYSINSKKEIYRYPSILLFNLSILTGTCEPDSWQTLRSLLQKKDISESIYHSLNFLLSCSCYVRLSAYLYHDSQDDRLSVLPNLISSQAAPASQAGKRWYLAESLFREICEHTVPLKEHISRCTSTNIFETIKIDINPSTWHTTFLTLFCCHRYEETWDELKKHFSNNDLLENTGETIRKLNDAVHGNISRLWYFVHALGVLLFQHQKYTEGLKVYSSFLGVSMTSTSIEEHELQQIVTASLDEVALDLVYLDKHYDALNEYLKTLNMRVVNLKPNHELIAYSHCFIGRCYKHMKLLDEAEAHLVKALHIYNFHASKEVVHDYYGDPVSHVLTYHSLECKTSPDTILQYLNNSSVPVGLVLWHLGTLYFSRKMYQRALNYLKKTELMHEETYGRDAFHTDTSANLYYLSYCYVKLGDLFNAEKYLHKAVLCLTKLFGQEHTDSFMSAQRLFSLGPSQKTAYYELVIEIFRKLTGYKELHHEIAAINLYYGIFLTHVQQPDMANEILHSAIDIFEKVISNGSSSELYCEDIAVAKSAQGLNYWKSGNTNLASEKFNAALAVLESVKRPSAQLEAAETQQNMGLMYAEQNDYVAAKSYLLKAQELYNLYCGDTSHPKLAEIDTQIKQVSTN